MLFCVRCGKPLALPQFECSTCKGDFCEECARKLGSCGVCSTEIARFKVPGLPKNEHFLINRIDRA